MRVRVALGLVTAAALSLPGPAVPLEKMPVRRDEDASRLDWRGFGTVSVAYYNTCTGWVWAWSGWSPADRLGVSFDNPCVGDPEDVMASRLFVITGAPSGYGYTGTVEVSVATPEGCPGEILQQQPFLPVDGWNENAWSARLREDLGFTMTVTLGPGSANPVVFATDHPAAQGGGPGPCGTCYPTTRENHSWVWAGPEPCPGTPFHDGTCDAQLLFEAVVFCNDFHTDVAPSSWGTIKGLYR